MMRKNQPPERQTGSPMQIVTTHKNTDFDAFASSIAATILYPGTTVVLPKSLNPNVKSFLSIHKTVFKCFFPHQIDLSKVKRLIIVDVNNWARLDGFSKLKKRKDLEILLWDHHPDEGDIQPSLKIKENVGATITLMVRQIKKEHKVLTPVYATLFLAGLYEDTGNLMFPSTTAEDARTAAYLLEQKADLNILGSFLRPAYGERQKDILFEMLKTAKRSRIGGYSVGINVINYKGHVSNLSLVVTMYREILNLDAAFGVFCASDQDRCIVIGRSVTDGLDIGSIMRSIGGGGHQGAGSAMLKSVKPQAVIEMIRELIEGNQFSSVRVGDIMSFPVNAIRSDTSMKDAALFLREKGCTGIPIIDDEELVGMISRRDFRKIKKDSALNAPVKAFMCRNVVTIGPDKSPMQASRLMVKHDIGRLPVVENGKVIGIITRSDVMIYFYDLLPD